LHLSFDLCDRAASIETFSICSSNATTAMPAAYAPQRGVEKVASLGRTEEFKHEIETLQQQHKAATKSSGDRRHEAA